MTGVAARTLLGSDIALDQSAVDELRARLGDLTGPDDHGYDAARRVWNGMIDRRPALVARCRRVADVIECVRFAREQEILLAVRGGGHNVAGFGTCDGGLVVDLSAMNGVRVDPRARTVRAGGGATWADLDRETQVFGLAAPGGVASTTGIAGLTLGGGQGWLRRTCGMACDQLLSADVVTADGAFRVASQDEEAELFWALRGGGGNFGIVTSFEYRLHAVGPTVAFASPVYPIEQAPEVLPQLDRFMRDAPDEINASAVLWTVPAAPTFPETLHGRQALTLGAMHAGSAEEGQRALRPLRAFGAPILDMSDVLPYRAVQKLFDPLFPNGGLHYWKAIYIDRLDETVTAELLAHLERRPSPMSMLVVCALGGALGRVDASETAVGDRSAPYYVEVLASWAEPAEAERNIAWARGCVEAMAPFSSGQTNLNFPGMGEDGEPFVRAAVGANYARLVGVKRTYDPANLFRVNQNIAP